MIVEDQTLYELYKGKDYHIEPTLERIERAVEYVGLKKPSYVSLLVGGTNGRALPVPLRSAFSGSMATKPVGLSLRTFTMKRRGGG